MCRSRVCNVVDVATLRVVMMAFVVAATTVTSQSKDIYSKPEILVIKPDKNTPNFWSQAMKHQKYNDPPPGYREIFGIPWALFRPAQLAMYEVTKPPPPEAPYAHPNMDDGTMSQNIGSYSRRSASNISPAQKEYEAVRRALARDRVQPLRRSMVPAARRMMTQHTRKQNEKTIEDLLPLMFTIANLIDKLDSPIDEKKQTAENGTGSTKQRITIMLKDVISRLQSDVHDKTKYASAESKNVNESKEHSLSDSSESHVPSETEKNSPKNDSSTIDDIENVTKDKSLDGIKFSDNRTVLNAPKPEIKPTPLSSHKLNEDLNQTKSTENGKESTSNMTTIKKQNSNNTGAEPSLRIGLDQSEVPAWRFMSKNTVTKSASESLENSDLIPEHRAFKITGDYETAGERKC